MELVFPFLSGIFGMKNSVFIDQSILRCLMSDRRSLKPYIEATQRWWACERENYQLCMPHSDFLEVYGGNNSYYSSMKMLYLNSVEMDIKQLEVNDNVLGLTAVYAAAHGVKLPESDAKSLAYASVYDIDFLLTWRCNNLANAHKRKSMRIINARLGLKMPEITTPLQLFTDDQYFQDIHADTDDDGDDDDDKDYSLPDERLPSQKNC